MLPDLIMVESTNVRRVSKSLGEQAVPVHKLRNSRTLLGYLLPYKPNYIGLPFIVNSTNLVTSESLLLRTYFSILTSSILNIVGFLTIGGGSSDFLLIYSDED